MEEFKDTKEQILDSYESFPYTEDGCGELHYYRDNVLMAMEEYKQHELKNIPDMLNSLQETRESISLMKVCLSEVTDDTIELDDILDNWQARNQEAINKALGQNK